MLLLIGSFKSQRQGCRPMFAHCLCSLLGTIVFMLNDLTIENRNSHESFSVRFQFDLKCRIVDKKN